MNTRTRTNLHIGKDTELFAELVSVTYKNGAVAVIFEQEHKELACRVADALFKKGNRTKLCEAHTARTMNFGEHIRYFVAVGGLDAIRAVRKAAGDMRFSFYPTEIFADCFCDGMLSGEKSGFAEIAYFDSSIIDISDTLTAAKGFCEALVMYYSLLDDFCSGLLLPYKDAALEAMVKQCKNFIVKPADKDFFLPTMLHLLKGGAEYLSGKDRLPVVYRIRNKRAAAEALSSRFVIAYLLFSVGIIFTKWDFNDMLIPAATHTAAELDAQRALKQQSAKMSAYMLSKEELNSVALIFRALGVSLEDIDIGRHFSMIIEESRRAQGLTNIINNTGVIERLINYEENQGY